ncbi:MAG: cyclic nucleotide-binding domain-containing protein [Oscillospiraceae bacterium]|nr:cyclic nucleotide-binding domain-containing protein [Oscillospiraceae bacterium]
METKRFQKGEVIFREGSAGEAMYEIKSGAVGIYAGFGTPDEKKLTELEPGRLFGELAVIDGSARSATAAALDEVEAVEISADDLKAYFKERPEKLMEIMRGMSRRLRELTADYREVCASIGEWKESTERGGKKRTGLMAAIRKYAAIFAESAKYMPMPSDGLYFRSYYLY